MDVSGTVEVEADDAMKVEDGGPGMEIDDNNEDVSDEDALEEEVAEGTYDATPKT